MQESIYKPEMELVDRYQAFTAELLRLSLLGIAVFGFLYKEVFLDFDMAKHPAILIDVVKWYAARSMVMFGLCAMFALAFRYFSTEGFRLYLEAFDDDGNNDTKYKKSTRCWFLWICICSKALAAATLAGAAIFMSLAFARSLG